MAVGRAKGMVSSPCQAGAINSPVNSDRSWDYHEFHSPLVHVRHVQCQALRMLRTEHLQLGS